MKTIIVLILLVIGYSLSSALFYFFKDKDQSPRMLKALTLRVALSVGLFILLLAAFAMGWLQPHGLLPE